MENNNTTINEEFTTEDVQATLNNTKIRIKNKTYSLAEYQSIIGIEDIDILFNLINKMVNRGECIVVEDETDTDKLIRKMKEQDDKDNLYDKVIEEEKQSVQYRRNKQAEDCDLLKIALQFTSGFDADNAEYWVNSLGINDTSIIKTKGIYKLVIENITPDEYTKIARRYKLDNMIQSGVNSTSKLFNSASDAINYGTTKVIAPTAKIVTEAGMNIGKGLFHTAVKTGASLINSGSKAIAETKTSLATDSEMIKASKELRDAKNAFKRFFKKTLDRKSGNGIEIL